MHRCPKVTSATVPFAKFSKPALSFLFKISSLFVIWGLAQMTASGKRWGVKGQEAKSLRLTDLRIFPFSVHGPSPQLTERREQEKDKKPWEFWLQHFKLIVKTLDVIVVNPSIIFKVSFCSYCAHLSLICQWDNNDPSIQQFVKCLSLCSTPKS